MIRLVRVLELGNSFLLRLYKEWQGPSIEVNDTHSTRAREIQGRLEGLLFSYCDNRIFQLTQNEIMFHIQRDLMTVPYDIVSWKKEHQLNSGHFDDLTESFLTQDGFLSLEDATSKS